MTDSQLPTAGSLSARIIRACPMHKTCPLTCPRRPVEDLGEIASFGPPDSAAPSPSLPRRIGGWLEHLTHRGGT